MLREVIMKVANPEGQKQWTYHPRPSNASNCRRQLTYQGLGIEGAKRGDRFALVLDDSSWHEELTLDWLRKSSFKVHSEQMKVEIFAVDGRMITGSIDGIVTDITGKDYLLEHKAINHFTFQRIDAGEVPTDYVIQCILYLIGLHRVSVDLTDAILLIKNKNTAQYTEFKIVYDHKSDTAIVYDKDGNLMTSLVDTAKNVRERFNDIDNAIKTKTLPKRDFGFDDWQCEYCPYNEMCWANYIQEASTFKKTGIIPEEYANDVVEFNKLNTLRKQIEKQETELKSKIRTLMRNNTWLEAVSGDFVVKMTVMEQTRISKDLIPVEILEKVQETSTIEKLSVNFIKKEKKENEKVHDDKGSKRTKASA